VKGPKTTRNGGIAIEPLTTRSDEGCGRSLGGRTMTGRALGLCPLAAASTEAHRAIKKHIARTERIAFAPLTKGERSEAVTDSGIYLGKQQ